MGSLGADEAGEDMTVGRTNKIEERTILVATGAPNGYADDFVLNVSIQNDAVLTSIPGRGIDAIHAKGTLPLPTGSTTMGTIPPGNGIIAQGINGIVGYIHAITRNRSLENSVVAGVVGIAGGASVVGGVGPSPGVFGIGRNGVVGIEQATTRDLAFEAAQKAGVVGRGETGVSGDGANGPGVFGRGLPGVQGQSTGGPGVLAEGQTGVHVTGTAGDGVHATSTTEHGAVLESRSKAQLWLIPLRMKDPTALATATAGEVLATVWADERGTEITSLWFCTRGGTSTAQRAGQNGLNNSLNIAIG
jgi:hypothetical protein